MAFRFHLDFLRRIRESYERREKLHLMLLMGHMAGLQHQIAAVESDKQLAREQFEQRLRTGMLGGEVHFEVALNKVRDSRWRGLLRQAEEIEKQCQIQQVTYMNARKAHEILVRLRARAWDLYRQDERRREQQYLDELHLQTRSANPASELLPTRPAKVSLFNSP
jgi:flagellar export protein FliJ